MMHLSQFIAEIVILAAPPNIAVNEINSIALYWSVVTITEHLV